MENMQGAQVAPGAGENPEMSRRGAFAAGGLALAALVAGGCGWLAMNAGKSTATRPTLSTKIVDKAPSAKAFEGFSSNVDETNELFKAGIPTGIAKHLVQDSRKTPAALSDPKTGCVEFSFEAFEPGTPYLVTSDLYVDKWAPDEKYDGVGAVEYGPDGKPAYIASRTYIGRASKVIKPDKSSGHIGVEMDIPSSLASDETFFTVASWNRLKVL